MKLSLTAHIVPPSPDFEAILAAVTRLGHTTGRVQRPTQLSFVGWAEPRGPPFAPPPWRVRSLGPRSKPSGSGYRPRRRIDAVALVPLVTIWRPLPAQWELPGKDGTTESGT